MTKQILGQGMGRNWDLSGGRDFRVWKTFRSIWGLKSATEAWFLGSNCLADYQKFIQRGKLSSFDNGFNTFWVVPHYYCLRTTSLVLEEWDLHFISLILFLSTLPLTNFQLVNSLAHSFWYLSRVSLIPGSPRAKFQKSEL